MIHSPLLEQLAGYVDGAWLKSDAGRMSETRNPATGETLAQVPFMGAAETRRAIAAAASATGQVPALAQRRQWLVGIGDALRDQRKELARIICLEHGKPWKEAEAEVDYAASFFDHYARTMADVLAPEELVDRAHGRTWTVHRRPIGVAGLITPWNFPIAMIAKKMAPALAAGCPVIVKPAPETPLTMIAVFQLLERHLALPAGMANLVMGDAAEIGAELMASPQVPMISFTGSTRVGQLLIEQSRVHVKKLGLELGGNAPFIVLDDADLDLAVENLLANKFRGAGQTCVCANRIYVQSGVYAAFSEKLVARVRDLKVSNGLDADTDIGPLINAAGFDKVRQHLADALDRGARQLTGTPPQELDAGAGLFFPPAVIAGVQQGMRCCREETFGPLLPLISFDTDEEALELANDTLFGLAAYVFGRDRARAHQLIGRLHFAHCGYNTGTGPAAGTPFGGMLHSGLGREGGREGLLEYVELQAVPEPLHPLG